MAEGLRKRDRAREREIQRKTKTERERESLREYECLCNEGGWKRVYFGRKSVDPSPTLISATDLAGI